ncbi:MAG: A/G-specific adenine glycosylase, partial [Proteobacteria bacterium]|nr:A/G-specific adenine glycosylase [Pseudomonadota bacterium]
MSIQKIQKQLKGWYRKHHRRLPWRETTNPYHTWVSEVMLQQTQVKTVLPYYQNFLIHFPDVKHLADSDLQEVLKAWEGLGYYARARNLHRASKIILAEHNGRVPDSLE